MSRTTPHLRAQLLKRIANFGSGRVEIHTAILEALIRESSRAFELEQAIETIINRGPYLKLHSIGDGYCVHGEWHSNGCIECASHYLRQVLAGTQTEKQQ